MSKAVKAVGAIAVGVAVGFVAGPWAGIAVAGSLLSRQLAKPPSVGAASQAELKQVIRSSKEPARYVFGRAGTGALLAWAQEQPGEQQENERLHLVYVLTEGSIAGLDQIYVDQEPVASAGDRIEYELVNGAVTPNAYLLANSPDWQESQIGRDLAWVRVSLRYDPDFFASGIPDLLFEYRGRNDIYDPRTLTSGYTNNAALVILWYIRHRLRVPDDEILWDTFIDAANVCDEIITNPDGSTERRYTVSGGFKADERKDRVLADLEAACAGSLIRVGGKFGLQVGAYYGPYELTIDEDMVIGTVTGQTEVSRADAVNTMRGKFVSPEQRWTETDYPAVSVAEWVAEDGEEIEDTLDLRFVSSPYQAQRLANIALRRKRAGGTLELPLNFRGYACRPGRVVQVALPTLNISGEFRVVDWDFSGENGCRVTLQQEQPEIYDDAVGQPFNPFGFIQLPTGGIGSPTGLQYVLQNVGEVIQGRLIWNPVDAALHYNVVIKREGVAVQAAQVPAGVERCDVGGLEAGSYTAEVRARGRLGQSGPAIVSFAINVPPMPESVGISAANDSITLTPRLSGSYGRVEFEFRWHPTPLPLNQVAASAEYLSIGASYTHTGLTWGTDYHYYVRSVNAYGASPWLYVPASTTADIEQILQGLTGEIRESALDQTLQERIDKIDGPASLEGSVAQQVAQEAATRAQGLNAEAQARAEALAAEAQARANALSVEASDRADAIAAEAQARTQEIADEAAARAAAITTEQQARIDALDQERSERIDSFAAEAQARADAIAAETQNRTVAITQLSETVETEFDLLGLEINAIAAAYDATAASIYTMTQIRINDAEVVATQISQLSGKVDDNAALILDERQIRIDQYSSLATQVGILSARLDARPSLNSGFEPGADYDAWSATSGNAISAVISGVYSGLQSALVTSTTSSANPNSGGVRRIIAPETAAEFSGHEIRLAIYAKQPATGAAAEFALAYQVAGQSVQWQRFTPSAEWAFYDVVIDVPEGTGSAQHAVAIWGSTAGGGAGVEVDRLLVTFAETGIPEVTAAIEQIQQALVDQQQAVVQELVGFEAQLNSNAAAIQQETTARTTATNALAEDVQTLQASTQQNAAAIVAEREAWTTETEALAQELLQQTARIEGGEATLEELQQVSASEDEYLASLQRVMMAAEGVNAASYQYTVQTRVTQWEAQTVVNEQLLAQIGDANAAIEREALVRANENEALAQLIEEQAANFTDNTAALQSEATARADADEALGQRIDAVVATSNGNTASIQNEAIARANAVDALTSQINTAQSKANSNAALIQNEASTRASADQALTQQVSTAISKADSNTAAIQSEATTRASADSALSQRINAVVATSNSNTAAISSEQTARANADSALSNRVDNVVATANGNTAAIQSEASARASADSSLASQINTVVSKANGNTAAIQSEATTRANADSALSNLIQSVNSSLGGDIAAVNTLIETAIAGESVVKNGLFSTGTFAGWELVWSEMQITERNINSGSNAVKTMSARYSARFPNTGHTDLQRLRSEYMPVVAGDVYTLMIDYATAGASSSATFRFYVGWSGEGLSEQWDYVTISTTSTSWAKSEPFTVVAPQGATQARVLIRRETGGNGDLYVTNIRGYRIDDAMARRIDELVVTAGNNAAAIQSEATTRANADSSLASQINTVSSRANSNASAIQSEATTRANAVSSLTSQINTAQSKADSNAATIQSEATTRANAVSSLTSQINTAQSKANSNTSAIQSEATTRANAVSSLAQQINTVQVEFDDELASVQQATQSQYNQTTQRLEAMWTLRIDNGGRVSGFGLADDGQESLLGFRADRIYFAHPNSNDAAYPMILDSGSVVMNDALIKQLLFTKLRSSDGSLVFQNGRLQAQYIAANQLSVEWGQIQNVWVTNAQIATAAIDSVKVRTAAIGTLQIAGNAVTLRTSTAANSLLTMTPAQGWVPILADSINAGGANVIVDVSFGVTSGELGGIEIRRNGQVVVARPGGTKTLSITAHVGSENSGQSNYSVYVYAVGGNATIAGRSLGLDTSFR